MTAKPEGVSTPNSSIEQFDELTLKSAFRSFSDVTKIAFAGIISNTSSVYNGTMVSVPQTSISMEIYP
jgi:hypothetical protein